MNNRAVSQATPFNKTTDNGNGIQTRILAVPSWVVSGTIVENALFLRDAQKNTATLPIKRSTTNTEETSPLKEEPRLSSPGHKLQSVPAIQEIGLCFFETEPCLQYSQADLPHMLETLPFSWHVHLPMDLPWSQGGAQAAQTALFLMEKVNFLDTKRAVLHPPCAEDFLPSLPHTSHIPRYICSSAQNKKGPLVTTTSKATINTQHPLWEERTQAALREFVDTWKKAGRNETDILVENIRGNDLSALADVICETGCSVCVDIGHVIAYNQDELLESNQLMKRVRMVHLNAPAPEKPSKHMPLSLCINTRAYRQTARCLQRVPMHAVLMLEIFDWQGVQASLPILDELLHLTDLD